MSGLLLTESQSNHFNSRPGRSPFRGIALQALEKQRIEGGRVDGWHLGRGSDSIDAPPRPVRLQNLTDRGHRIDLRGGCARIGQDEVQGHESGARASGSDGRRAGMTCRCGCGLLVMLATWVLAPGELSTVARNVNHDAAEPVLATVKESNTLNTSIGPPALAPVLTRLAFCKGPTVGPE